MLAPKRQKFRKTFRGTWRRLSLRGALVSFGSVGLKTMDKGWVKDREIEACRVILARGTRKVGKFWIRIFPDKPFSKKPPEVTMGAGKGDIAYFVASVVPGKVMFEIDGLPVEEARAILKAVSMKLSVRTKIVTKEL